MRKVIIVGILLAAATVTFAAIDVSVAPGVWVGGGYRQAAPMFNVAFGISGKTLAYDFSLDYRKWSGEEEYFDFYMLNFDNYLVVNVTYDNPVDLYFAPLLSYGKASTSDRLPYYEGENYDNIGLGGKFGVVADYADGLGLVDFYFSYRGGIVLDGEGVDYLVTTKVGVEGHVPLVPHFRLKVSAGGLSDNFGFYEGMYAYGSFGSAFLYVGPEFVF
ncbi:MAG: hypothetical protein V3T41_04655 [bacterium]